MNKEVTLVLSGGGARGFAHIGAIEAIEKKGYKICSVSGTSMGALVGGMYAAGKINEFKEWAFSIDKHEILKLIDFSFTNQGLIKGEKLLKNMKKLIPDAKIEDLEIRYTATAFDLAQHKEIVFNEGSLYDAIRASISIPTVFTPVISGNSVLVDGGVINNIPISNAIRPGNDILIAVYVNADVPLNRPDQQVIAKRQNDYKWKFNEFRRNTQKENPSDQRKKFHYFNLINDTISAMTSQMASTIINNTPPDIYIEISKRSCGIFDFYRAQELVEIGRIAACGKLDSLF